MHNIGKGLHFKTDEYEGVLEPELQFLGWARADNLLLSAQVPDRFR